MTPYFKRGNRSLWVGDVRAVLAELPAESVQCVITSPPYLNLRAYGTAPQVWGEPAGGCEHEWGDTDGARIITGGRTTKQVRSQGSYVKPSSWRNDSGVWDQTLKPGLTHQPAATCRVSGCWRGELGSEPDVSMYIRNLIEVFAAVKRVLRKDGTLFVNLGDSMAGSGKGPRGHNGIGDQEGRQGFTGGRGVTTSLSWGKDRSYANAQSRSPGSPGIPAKSLLLVPERFAIAMQEAGWIVRSRLAGVKVAPMPESVTDRPTSAWEHVYMFAKQARYYWDGDAVAEPSANAALPSGQKVWNTTTTRTANGTALSRAALRPKVPTTLHTDHRTTNDRGWCDLGQSQVSVDLPVTGETKSLQVVKLIGFQIGVETPEGPLVIDLEPCSCSTEHTDVSVSLTRSLALLGPVGAAIVDAPTSPCGARLACPVHGDPLPSALEGAKVTAIELAFVANEGFAARITLDIEKTQATLFVWRTFGPAHAPPRATEGRTSIPHPKGRNLRNWFYWRPAPFPGSHFAVFPPSVPELFIKAATSEKGACTQCGTPWRRLTKPTPEYAAALEAGRNTVAWSSERRQQAEVIGNAFGAKTKSITRSSVTVGWAPSCQCGTDERRACRVLDPFSGSGTTMAVASRLEREAWGIELSQEYADMSIRERFAQDVLPLEIPS